MILKHAGCDIRNNSLIALFVNRHRKLLRDSGLVGGRTLKPRRFSHQSDLQRVENCRIV